MAPAAGKQPFRHNSVLRRSVEAPQRGDLRQLRRVSPVLTPTQEEWKPRLVGLPCGEPRRDAPRHAAVPDGLLNLLLTAGLRTLVECQIAESSKRWRNEAKWRAARTHCPMRGAPAQPEAIDALAALCGALHAPLERRFRVRVGEPLMT